MNTKNEEPLNERIRDQPITLMNALFQHEERLRRSHRYSRSQESFQSILNHSVLSVGDTDSFTTNRRRSSFDRQRFLRILEAACRLCDELGGDDEPGLEMGDDQSHDQMSD